MHFKTSF